MLELYIGNRKVGQTRTNASGSYTFRKKIKKKTRFGVQVLELADLALPCPAPPLGIAPQGCRMQKRIT